LRKLLIVAERYGQPIRLLGGEVFRLDDLSVGPGEIGAQLSKLALRRATSEREPHAAEIGLSIAECVALADCSEQIGAERQRQRCVDVVEQDDDRRRRVRQHEVPAEPDEATLVDGIASRPPRADVDTELELRGDALGDEPQAGVGSRAALLRDAAEIDRRNERAAGSEGARGAVQQTGFTDASSAEHAARPLCAQGVEELPIRRALDVTRPFRLYWAADHEKFRGLDHTRHPARL
jgi:hypothetical protein